MSLLKKKKKFLFPEKNFPDLEKKKKKNRISGNFFSGNRNEIPENFFPDLDVESGKFFSGKGRFRISSVCWLFFLISFIFWI